MTQRTFLPRLVVATVVVIGSASPAHADIFQWEYINPADPNQGKRQSTTLAPDGAGVNAVPDADLSNRNLDMAYLIGADLSGVNFSAFLPNPASSLTDADLSQGNLTNASFYGTTLTGADFGGAEIRGANFGVFAFYATYGTGISLDQLYSTASYRGKDLSGVGFDENFLDGADFTGQNLADASFYLAHLNNADFTGAKIQGANFGRLYYNISYITGIRLDQLYSTASYHVRDLSEIDFTYNFLYGASFAGQNLTNTSFYGATLTAADFTAADARGAALSQTDVIATNLIRPDGHIAGLTLGADRMLVVRDDDVGSHFDLDSAPIPITIDQHLTMAPGGALRIVFEADAWDSTISFAPGIPVTLGGTLELTFADDVNPATQFGRTFDLFDWTGVAPAGAFTVSSPYRWDVSNLYATGEVTLTAIPEPQGLLLFGIVLTALVAIDRTRPRLCLWQVRELQIAFSPVRLRIARLHADNNRPGLKRLLGRKAALSIMTLTACLSHTASSAALPVVLSYDHFTSRLAPHSFPGGLPVGDKVQVAAVLNSSDLVGSPTISVKAVQGATTLNLEYVGLGHPLFDGFHIYYKFIDLDPSLLGPWKIIPADSTGTGPATFTNAIAEPEFLPFVNNITLQGAPLGARVTWTLPNLVGFDVNGIGVRIIEAVTGSHVWQAVLPAQATAYEPPAGTLQIGVDYVYNIILSDDESFGHENASWSFSDAFRYTLPGDFNSDGIVDAADLAHWQGDFGQNADSDADNDHDSDGADFLAWQRQFNGAPPALNTADPVPEPAALLLALAALAIVSRRHPR
jgi:uncharacterized protein YjbI with pentapeptide repeats